MSLIMGKVCGPVMNNVVRVAIPRLRFDSFLCMHFRDSAELYALDKKAETNPGDWILVSKLAEKISLKVGYEVKKIVYVNGRMICPLTGKQSIGHYYAEDFPIRAIEEKKHHQSTVEEEGDQETSDIFAN